MNRDVCAICWCPYGDEGECGCKSVRVTDHFGDSNKMASEALRLADELEQYATSGIEKEVAREVRDLIREREALREDVQRFREAAHCERETRRQLERHNELLEASLKEARTLMEGYAEVKAKDEALLRQALEALEWAEPAGTVGRGGIEARKQAIAALRERLK